MFILWLYYTGCFRAASSTLNLFGNLDNIYLHFSLISSSADAPAPPVDLGSNDNIVDVMKLVSIIADDISALSCNPNTSV